MPRRLAALFVAAVLLMGAGSSARADDQTSDLIALGPYQMVNTAGFTTDANGQREDLPTDLRSVEVLLDLTRDRTVMVLTFETMRLPLPRLWNGLAAVDWGGSNAITLRREDILTLTGKDTLEDVDTYGAKIDWPDVGPATLVLFEAGGSSFAGFIISKPGGRTIVRQMEAHRYFASRPRAARGR
ncbi:hypothetical protein [Pannonibacter carbonis]|uniref:hypothetical protein n=1 Tax=Pannonibacter carbonis TaxID=2067569 RepID=UPI000D0F5C94|nr:hypothetical protein [Pannonibacter carbonis]